MIRIIGCSKSYNNNFVFKDFFPNRSRNLLVISHNLFEDDAIEQANTSTLEKLLKIDIQDLDEDKLDDFFSEMFIRLNWQLSTLFKELDSRDKGISLIFLMQINDRFHIYQFGRLLLGTIRKKKFTPIGRAWENFKIKSRKELFLLGGLEENINVKSIRLQLKKGEYLFCIPSDRIAELEAEKASRNPIEAILNDMETVKKFPHFLIGNISGKKKKRFLGIFGSKK